MKHTKFPKIESLDDKSLWEIVLTPIESNLNDDLKNYIKSANDEFSKRNIKLKPICK